MTPVMNTLHKLSSRLCVLFICLVICFTSNAQAQKEYTSISKNINPEAQGLYHDLSPQGDSLYLKAESIFYKVTFLNSLDRKVYNFNPPVLEAKIPLHDIIVGDYTVLIYKKDRIIVFHISRLLEIDKPSEVITTKDFQVNNEINIETPDITKINSNIGPVAEVNMNQIKINESPVLGIKELKKLKVDIRKNRLNLNVQELLADTGSKPYNLSSMDRNNVQSREDYRRNNLRPNGKPYY